MNLMSPNGKHLTVEHQRLADAASHKAHWRRWGPYLSERQWGTVREDYSEYGTAWDYLPHDHARSRAYRWPICAPTTGACSNTRHRAEP